LLENPREAHLLFGGSAEIVNLPASMPDPVANGLTINPFAVDHLLTLPAPMSESDLAAPTKAMKRRYVFMVRKCWPRSSRN
jgi:hypothetical protein